MQPELQDLRVAVGDLFLDHLLVGQPLTLGGAADDAFLHIVHRLVQHADGTHRMMDAAAAKARLRDLEPFADGAEAAGFGDTAIGEPQVAVDAAADLVLRTDRGVAHNLQPRGVVRNDQHRRALMDRNLGIGDDHDDQEFGDARVAGEPFLAVDHPFITIQPRLTGEFAGIGARLGFGHRIAGDNLAIEQRLEIFRLLIGRAEARKDFGIAGVGRLGAEYDRGKPASSEDFVHEAKLDLAKSRAAEFGAEVTGP